MGVLCYLGGGVKLLSTQSGIDLQTRFTRYLPEQSSTITVQKVKLASNQLLLKTCSDYYDSTKCQIQVNAVGI